MRVARRTSSAVLDEHWELARKALDSNLLVFHPKSNRRNPLPLWVELSAEGLSLRAFSLEWNRSLARLNIFLSEPYEFPPRHLSDAELLYWRGQYESAGAEVRKRGRSVWDDEALSLRIGIEAGRLDEVKSATFARSVRDDLWFRVAIQLMVAEKKALGDLSPRSREIIESVRVYVMNRSYACPSRIDFFLLNSLNYLLLGLEPVELTRERIEQKIVPLSAQIGDERQRRHVRGVAAYHLSILARHERDEELELSHLREAADLDYGFYDYDYRIAQILHDRRSAEAGKHYLRALETSSFDDSLINDYGCYLTDFECPKELSSWSALVQQLGTSVPVNEGALA